MPVRGRLTMPPRKKGGNDANAKIDKLINQAQEYLQVSDISQALLLLQKALTQRPNDTLIMDLLGMFHKL